MAGESAFGAQLWLDNDAGVLTKVARVLNVAPPGKTRETIDVTDHDSEDGEAEYIASGVKRTGPLTATIHRIADSATETLVYDAIDAADLRTFTVVEKKGAGLWGTSGECIVTGYEPNELEIEGKKTATVTLQPSGPITRAAFTA